MGTIYLLASRRLAHVRAALVVIGSAVAVVAVLRAHLAVLRAHLVVQPLATGGIPRGGDVVPSSLRALARVYSFAGFFVVVAGALGSAIRLARLGQDHLRRLVVANVLVATGTAVVALGSVFALYGRGIAFAVGLFVGVSLMFSGFLRTRPPKTPAPG